MLDGREAFGGTSGDALGGRIRRDEIRVLGFDPFELVQEAIELLVGDLRGVVDVVAFLVVADLIAQLGQALLYGLRSHAAREAPLPIAGKDVVGQREKRVALGTGWE